MILLSMLYIFLPAVQIAFFLPGRMFLGFNLPEALNYVASILLLHWLLANVIVASKLPMLQKHVPYDKRIQFHILSSFGIIVAVFYHAGFKLNAGYSLDPVTMLLGLVLFGMIGSAMMWIPVPFFSRVRKLVLNLLRGGKEGDYEKSKNFHRFILPFLGLLMFMHVFSTGIMLEVNAVATLLYFGLFLTAFGLFFISNSSRFRIPVEVVSVEKHREVVTLKLRPEKTFRYKPGQFTFFGSRNSRGKKEEHPFSFLSVDPELISLGIRDLGDFTSHLENLKVGEKAWIRGAFGGFRPGKEDAFCLIGSGIGVVPLISIVRDMVNTGDIRPVELFIAVNHRDEIPDKDDFLKTVEGAENINLHLLVYEEDGTLYSADYFAETIGFPKNYSYYLCSSPGVRKIVVNALGSLGVHRRAVHFEAFSFG